MLKQLIALVYILSLAFQVNASHLVGGEIFYTCLGGNQYEITLKVYRDCYTVNGAGYDNPAIIGVYNSSGMLTQQLQAPFNGSEVLDVVIENPCLQAPPDICVEEAVYNVTVDLPYISGGYHIAYQRCCRNPTIVNLANAGDQGSTYYVHIPDEALNTCNSGPSFNSFPPLALCIGDVLTFDHSATDSDGDQLVYSLCAPYHGGDQLNPQPIPPLGPPYVSINWNNGYGSSYPMDASPQLNIDSSTGILTGAPSQAGQYVVGVCVEEYRNGQLISTNIRDFQFNVVNCESNIEAVIPIQSFFHNPCDGLEVDFGNQSINADFFHWDFGVESILSDTSNLEEPTFTYPDTGVYWVTLIANPGYPCADTTVDDILIYNDVSVEIQVNGEFCSELNSVNFDPTGSFGLNATFFWEFENAMPSTSFDMSPQGVVFDTAGLYEVSVEVTEALCSDLASTTVEIYPKLQAFFHGDTLKGCPPLGVLLEDSSLASTPYQASWSFGDGFSENGLRVFHGYTESGIYDIALTIWTDVGCADTSTYVVPNAIEVWPIPTAQLTVEPDTQFIYDPIFTFTGTTDGTTCKIFPGDGTSYLESMPNCTFEHFYTDTGNYQAIMHFEDNNGCTSSDSVWIRVEPEVRFWVPNAFSPNADRVNDTWGPKAFGFSEYEIWVFDKWGKQVFHSEDPFEKWNGRYYNQSNLEPVVGVYAYRILARSVKNTVVREFGHVTILR